MTCGPPSGHEARAAVVALHGFLGCGADWDDVTAAARARRPDLAWDAPDLPGHGVRPAPAPPSFAGWVDWLVARLDRSVHLLGYSFGGRLALAAALDPRARGRVRTLTLVSSSPGIAGASARARRRAEDEARAARLEAGGLAPFLDHWYRQPLFAPLAARLGVATLVARRGEGDARALAAALRAAGAGAMPDLRPHLAQLDAPVLVLAGARDPRYTALAREVEARAPRARAAVVAGAGHALLLEAPATVAERWCDFLREVDDE